MRIAEDDETTNQEGAAQPTRTRDPATVENDRAVRDDGNQRRGTPDRRSGGKGARWGACAGTRMGVMLAESQQARRRAPGHHVEAGPSDQDHHGQRDRGGQRGAERAQLGTGAGALVMRVGRRRARSPARATGPRWPAGRRASGRAGHGRCRSRGRPSRRPRPGRASDRSGRSGGTRAGRGSAARAADDRRAVPADGGVGSWRRYCSRVPRPGRTATRCRISRSTAAGRGARRRFPRTSGEPGVGLETTVPAPIPGISRCDFTSPAYEGYNRAP